MTVTRARDIVVPGLMAGLLAVGLLLAPPAAAAAVVAPAAPVASPATYGCPGEPPWWAAGRCGTDAASRPAGEPGPVLGVALAAPAAGHRRPAGAPRRRAAGGVAHRHR